MTTTKTKSLRSVLNSADPNELADALRLIKLGNRLSVIKATIASLTAASAVDITSAGVKAAATISGITLESGENLPPIAHVLSLRVTASGTAGSLGVYGVGDTGATAIVPPGGAGAAMGIAKISDDGKTLTFPNTITGFVIQYIPRQPASIANMDTEKFTPST